MKSNPVGPLQTNPLVFSNCKEIRFPVCELARRSQTQRASTEAGADQACTGKSFIPGSEGLAGFNREYLTGVLNKVKVSGKGKREEPSIRIRDESLASLGFRTSVSLGFSKTDAKC